MTWYKIRPMVLIALLALFAGGIALWLAEVPDYWKKVHWTEFSLRLARLNVSSFREITGRFPDSLAEINQYASQHPDSGLRERPFGEYITETDGNREEHAILTGEGGLHYDKETGVVKVNLTEPLGHYLPLYWGSKRRQIPAEW
ncbi:MAG: hypothetical protein GTN65_12095 [Armatimonadetes bacterium]|nr:hypothetical protein [Armatimonadota bacterium]NIO97808.1 hypothetical protein [Armatimonadota bacterium]